MSNSNNMSTLPIS